MVVNDQKFNDVKIGIHAAQKDIESANVLIEQADKVGNEAAKTMATRAKELAYEATLKFQKALGSDEHKRLYHDGADLIREAEEYLNKALHILQATGENKR